MDNIQKIITDLIKFKSTRDNPQEITKCLNYIRTYFKDSKIFIKQIDF